MTRSLVPWRERLPQFFGDFEKDVENLFEQFFTTGNVARGIQAFAPRTTVAETDNEYEVEVDLPGMKPEDVQVEMRGNELVAHRRAQAGEGGKRQELPPHRAGVRALRARDSAGRAGERGEDHGPATRTAF